jgi:hypothetical protein
MPAYFGECLAKNLTTILEDIDIIRGAFLKENVEARQAHVTL